MTSPLTSQSSEKPPVAYRANRKYIQWPVLIVVINLIIIVIAIKYKQYPLIALFGMMGLAFLALALSALTLRVTISEEGLRQRWIWGWRTVGWQEIASIERVRRQFFGDGLFLLNEKNYEIFAVSALSYPDQMTITEEAIKRARLKKDKKPLKKNVMERWIRK
jgi:hypothetical protein